MISSVAAQTIAFPVPIYGASKAAISSFTRSLGPLEPMLNIRINAVAPGRVKTPIWTEDKLKWVAEDDEWATTEEVASAMLELVEKDEFVGGTVLEVAKGRTRRVELFNDPGPMEVKEGSSTIEKGQVVAQVLEAIESEFGK